MNFLSFSIFCIVFLSTLQIATSQPGFLKFNRWTRHSKKLLGGRRKKAIFKRMSHSEQQAVLGITEGRANIKDAVQYICTEPSDSVFIARYEILDLLGQGCHGNVHRVLDKCTNTEWALKEFRLDNKKCANSFEREVDIMKLIGSHDHIVPFERRFILMPIMNGILLPEVDQRISPDEEVVLSTPSAFGTITIDLMKTILRQLVSTVRFVHSKDIVINDLKPANILIESKEPPIIRLADFGLASCLSSDNGRISFTGAYAPLEKQLGLVTSDKKSDDIWAIGCIIKELIFGYTDERSGYPLIVYREIVKYMVPGPSDNAQDILIEISRMISRFSAGYGDLMFPEGLMSSHRFRSLPKSWKDFYSARRESFPRIDEFLPNAFKSDIDFVSFFKACLQFDEEKRATVQELSAHPFLHTHS
eukprot:Partr_v1_DN26755_c0_g1_i1_m8927